MPDIKNLSDLRELVKWLDESWLEAKRDAEAWDLKGKDARVAKLTISIDDQGDQTEP